MIFEISYFFMLFGVLENLLKRENQQKNDFHSIFIDFSDFLDFGDFQERQKAWKNLKF